MRIAFFGLPLAAALLVRDGHDVVYAGLVVGPGFRRVTTRLLPGRARRFPDLASARTMAEVRAAAPELLVSWFWTKPVPPACARPRAVPRRAPVALAQAPGTRIPYFWTIAEGDEVTGVTAHRLDEAYDTGAILAQRRVPVASTWNAWKLAKALDRPGLALLREVVRAHAEGRAPYEVTQDESLATDAPKPEEEDLALRWTWSAAQIERRVRAAAPWPGAWTEIGDEVVVVVRARATTDFPRVLAPGEAAVRADGVAVVRAADEAVELLEGRAENEEVLLSGAALARIVSGAVR